MSLFKKKKIKQAEERQIINKRIIAVWGSPYSGKSTIATKLAKELTKKEKNVGIVYADYRLPMLPLVVDKASYEEIPFSVGELLQLENVTEDIISEKTNLIHNEFLGIYGYKYGENEYSYPDTSKEQVKKFLDKLIQIYDYVIVDCTSSLSTNMLSATSMLEADVIIKISDVTNKSVIFYSSSKNVLENPILQDKKQINIINKIESIELEQYDFGNNIKMHIPYTKEVIDQNILGNLFKGLEYKQSRKFREAISKIADEVLYV